MSKKELLRNLLMEMRENNRLLRIVVENFGYNTDVEPRVKEYAKEPTPAPEDASEADLSRALFDFDLDTDSDITADIEARTASVSMLSSALYGEVPETHVRKYVHGATTAYRAGYWPSELTAGELAPLDLGNEEAAPEEPEVPPVLEDTNPGEQDESVPEESIEEISAMWETPKFGSYFLVDVPRVKGEVIHQMIQESVSEIPRTIPATWGVIDMTQTDAEIETGARRHTVAVVHNMEIVDPVREVELIPATTKIRFDENPKGVIEGVEINEDPSLSHFEGHIVCGDSEDEEEDITVAFIPCARNLPIIARDYETDPENEVKVTSTPVRFTGNLISGDHLDSDS